MAQYTTQGEQYIAEKSGTGGVFNITHFVLANIEGLDHTQQPPSSEQMPASINIVDEQPVTQKGYLNANQTVYSLVLDSTVGDYQFNWIGLKTDDGRLLSVAYDAPQIKQKYDGSQEGNNITRNFVIEFEGAKDAAAIEVSAETWQIDFSARLNQIDENQRLAGRDIFGQNTFFGAGFGVVREDENHVIKAGLGYIEGIRLFLAADINLGPVVDKGIWIDAGIVNDAGIATGKIVSKLSARSVIENNYFSTEQHYLFKIAEVDYNGVVTDRRRTMPSVDDGFIHLLLRKEQLSNSVANDSESDVATSKAVKAAFDKANHDHPYALSSTTYSKAEVNSELIKKANASTTYTKTEVNSELIKKANASTTYSKAEVNAELDKKANASSTYSKAEVNTALGNFTQSLTLEASDLGGDFTFGSIGIERAGNLVVICGILGNTQVVQQPESTIPIPEWARPARTVSNLSHGFFGGLAPNLLQTVVSTDGIIKSESASISSGNRVGITNHWIQITYSVV